jgi:uncharacterized Fe-S cluster-containing radical SAM superfamily protein
MLLTWKATSASLRRDICTVVCERRVIELLTVLSPRKFLNETNVRIIGCETDLNRELAVDTTKFVVKDWAAIRKAPDEYDASWLKANVCDAVLPMT